MAIELTTILHHANAVNSAQSDHAQIHITGQGAISDTSGLGFFKRLFSSSARAEENRTTLQAFQNAIAQSPAYREHLEKEQVAKFFQTKRAEATPLTAKDVQLVNTMLDMEKAREMGQRHIDRDLLPENYIETFSMLCVQKGLPLDSEEDIKNAFKEFVTHLVTVDIRQQLSAANVFQSYLDGLIRAAMGTLMASSAWSAAQNSTFERDLNTLPLQNVIDDFAKGVQPAVDLILSLINNSCLSIDFFQNMTESQCPVGMPLFNGTFDAIVTGAIAKEDAPSFFKFCYDNNFNMGSPELLSAAISKYHLTMDAKQIFITMAKANGLPERDCGGLAYNPEFTARAEAALEARFPDPKMATSEGRKEVLEGTASAFMTDKIDDIPRLLALPSPSYDLFSPTLSPLLSGQALLDHLLDPAKGPDLNLINLMDNFMVAMNFSRHSLWDKLGDDQAFNDGTEILAMLVRARVANSEDLSTLLEQVNTSFSALAPSLQSLNSGLNDGTITASNNLYASHAINRMQTVMRMMSNVAYNAATEQQRQELGISAEQADFYSSLEYGSQGELLPVSDIHQSVRAFGARLGLSISQEGYQETVALAENVALELTGSTEEPVVTDRLLALANEIAQEINFNQFNEAYLDPGKLGTMVREVVSARAHNELLNQAQARETAGQAIRDNLLALKVAMDYIRDLPTQADPDSGQEFIVTEAEKERFLQVIPGTPLRDPKLIKVAIEESRALIEPLSESGEATITDLGIVMRG